MFERLNGYFMLIREAMIDRQHAKIMYNKCIKWLLLIVHRSMGKDFAFTQDRLSVTKCKFNRPESDSIYLGY